MKILGSNDINLLSIAVTFDISGTTPQILLENQSTGDDLASCSWWFIIKSPTQTIIHEGSETSPDETGVWTDAAIADAWPRPFNQIEWSGAEYSFQAYVKDGDGNIYGGEVQGAAICRPNGNTPTSKNTYGKGSVLVQVKCEQARIYFQDTTNTSYKGLTGTVGSSTLRVNFPMDETGTVPDPFISGHFSSVLVPITYSGKGYQFLYTSIYEYDLGNNVFVRIKYLFTDTFGVWCNIDLLPLLCEYQKLISSIETGNCSNAEEANRKLMLINPKFSMVVMGMFQPLTGIDVPALIEEIKVIGGFDCDCCNAASGIIPNTSAIFEGYNFTVTPLGGDVEGEFVVNGVNIDLEISDIKYVFRICDSSPTETTAFTVRSETTGFTKTYCLNIDVAQLAEDLLTVIGTDAGLVALFNTLVVNSGNGNFNLVVDGSCIFNTALSCDYEFTLSSIPSSSTFAILSSIQTLAQNYTVSYPFNLTNLSGLQNYLNALGIGTFVVTNPSGQTVLISSTANTFDLVTIAYKNPTTQIASLSKECTGFEPLTANEVVQNIINYLCDLDDTQVVTSQEYEICYIDPADSTQKVATVDAGEELTTFIQALLARGCDTINYIVSLGAVNCTAIRAQFPTLPIVMQSNDFFLGTKSGQCSQILPTEAFLYMLTYGQYSADVLAAFCNMVTLCSGGLPCAPYDVFYASVDAGSPAGADIDLIVTFDHPEAISHTIRYARIDNTNSPSYVTIPGILPGQSPYTINVSPSLQNGQYRVYIRPIYSDGRLCSESVYETPDCSGINSFSVSYDGVNINITYSAEASLEAVKVNINYPNGGFFSQVYANGDPIVISPPAEVFGTFFVTMQPVCNEDTGFFGVATAPGTFIINPPFNSFLVNNSTLTQTTVGIFSYVPGTTQLSSTSLGISDQVPFYIADGTYFQLYLRVDVADRDSLAATLVTGTGSYSGVPYGLGYFIFSGVPILNGAVITLTDDASPSSDNYTLSASYNFSIDSVTGSGIPALPSTGTNNNLSGVQTGMSGAYQITLSGSLVTTTKLNALVNGIVVECSPVTAPGIYSMNITATGSDDVLISVDSGTC